MRRVNTGPQTFPRRDVEALVRENPWLEGEKTAMTGKSMEEVNAEQKELRRTKRELKRRLDQFLEYASSGNLLALTNILKQYQDITGDAR